jgi:hypothetical protein
MLKEMVREEEDNEKEKKTRTKSAKFFVREAYWYQDEESLKRYDSLPPLGPIDPAKKKRK